MGLKTRPPINTPFVAGNLYAERAAALWMTEISAAVEATIDSVNGNTGTVVLDSDDISEGSVNLYLTTAERAKLANIDEDGVTFTSAEKTKLSGIETGAQANDVSTVNGQTGAVDLRPWIDGGTASTTYLGYIVDGGGASAEYSPMIYACGGTDSSGY